MDMLWVLMFLYSGVFLCIAVLLGLKDLIGAIKDLPNMQFDTQGKMKELK